MWTTSDTPVSLRLQKSANGVDWHDVSGSQLTTDPAKGRYQRALGVGSTVSSSSHGRRGRGYRYYRLVTTSPSGSTGVGHVHFWLTGTRHYRNADRVVHLYNYLLAGANAALREADEPQLVDQARGRRRWPGGSLLSSNPVGAQCHRRSRAGRRGRRRLSTARCNPVRDFYVRSAPGTSTATLTATTPQALVGRVLTGVAADEAAQRFTPVALAAPTDVAIHFDIGWD